MNLARIGERVELTYKKRRLTVSTVELPGGIWESMVFQSCDGAEIESRQTRDAEQAAKNHAAFVKKYTTQTVPEKKPLTGKYKKLAEDLKQAHEAALAACANVDDGGTCNFDSPALDLPRWNGEQIKEAAKAAGVGAWKWESFGHAKWVICPRSGAQGNKNSAVAEYMAERLRGAGYDCMMYYAMD